jgi:hypothetical protein
MARMAFGIGRASVRWLIVAGGASAVAVILTMAITWTEGGLLERGQNDSGGHPVQLISIYERGATRESAEDYYINYGETADGSEGLITFFVPPSAQPVLVLSRLVDDKGCSSLRTADDDSAHSAYGGGINVEIARHDTSSEGEVVHVVRPTPSDFRTTVSCRVRPATRSDTFTSRILPIKHYAPARDPAFRDFPQLLATIDPDITAALAGADPLPTQLINFSNIPGARSLRFIGGFDPEGEYAHESKRLVVAGEFSWVMWDDIYRQQTRDILLIVIGTLIGIAVTVLIEGLRPIIERADKPHAPDTPAAPPPASPDSP